jgi:hypothetical protein
MSPDWSAKEEPVPYAKLDDPQSLNLYAYVLNNPMDRVDPDGHAGLSDWLKQKVCGFGVSSFCASRPQQQQQQQQQVNSPGQLTDAQNSAMGDPNLQPGAHGHPSHCSEATCQIAHAVGANTAPLGPSNGGFYVANQQVANLARASATPGSGWHLSDLASAQQSANQGRLTVIGWTNPNPKREGHTVTVMADPGNTHGATNPTVAQVGGSTGNGSMGFRYAFGGTKRGQVQVYVYTGR